MSDEVDDFLAHFGVKGMKWGQRKSSKIYVKQETKTITTKLKSGDTLTLNGDRTPAFSRFLARHNSKIREGVNNASSYTLKDKNGQTVGEMHLFKESKDSLNVNWVGVRKKARGNGYATAAMNAALEYAKAEKLQQITLEVPGDSKDARHIYEKMGFKVTKELSPDDDVWGGLTEMKLKL